MANCVQCDFELPLDAETQFCSKACDMAHEREYEDMCEQEREKLLFDFDEEFWEVDELKREQMRYNEYLKELPF